MRNFKTVLAMLIVGLLVLGTVTVSAAELDTLKGVTEYELWLGSTQVTSSNCNNILGDNTASFNPSSNTLTLNNPTRIDYYQDFMIASKLDELTVKGTYKMSGSNKTMYGIFSKANLTLDGNFEFIATDCGILVDGDLVINSGTVKANAVGATGVTDATGIACGTLTVENGITRIEAKGAFAGIESTKYTFGSTVDVTTPANYEFRHPVGYLGYLVYSEGGSAPATNVVISQAGSTTTHYNVWLGEKEVTSRNKSNILGDGKASFDPESNTLTLNNPTISGSFTSASNENTFKIFSEDINLTLKGSYIMTSAECYGGIRSKRSLVLDGDFKFLATNFAVAVENQLTVKSGTLTVSATGENALGINAGTLLIENTITKFDVQSTAVPVSARNIQMGSGLKFVTPEDGAIGQETSSGFQFFCDGNGNTVRHVVIEPKQENPTVSYNLVVGNVAVTNKNKDDILNDGGKAKYNPDTKTLTLNNPTIDGYFTFSSNNYKILALDDITLEGSYAMPQDITIYTGLYGEKTVTLKGDFSFNGSYSAVYAKGDITVSSGSLKASSSGRSSIAVYSTQGGIYFNNGITKAEMNSGYVAALGKTINLGDEMKISSPNGAQVVDVSGQSLQTIATPPSSIANNAVIEPITKYNIWIGEKQVTEKNKDDILNDGGKAKFDIETNTLTLDNPAMAGTHSENSTTYKIYADTDLIVKGTYNMTSDDAATALYANGSLSFEGDFTFKGSATAVYAEKGITLVSGTFNAGSGTASAVINKSGILTVKEDITHAEAQSDLVAVLSPEIQLEGILTVITPENGTIAPYGSTGYKTVIDASSNAAKNLVIEPHKQDDTDDTDDSDDSDNTDTTGTTDTTTDTSTDTTTDTSTDTSSNLDDTDVSYSLWVGSTQVTSKNKDDILGDGGKAKFDPKTNTLTLNDPVINSKYTDANSTNESKIYCREMNLTVKGSYNMEQMDTNCGIRVYNASLTISGNFTFRGKLYALCSSGDMTIASGNVKLFSNSWGAAAANHGKLLIENQVECVEAKSEVSYALYGQNGIELGNKLYVETPGDGTPVNNAQYVVIKHKPVEKYNLWIGSTQVTSENMEDILVDGGKAKYDPETKTLTLDNPVITGTVKDDTGWNSCNIRAYGIDLTVKGNYFMTECAASFGICAEEGSLTLDGDFTFIGSYDAIYSQHNLTLASGTIKALGNPEGPVREGIWTNSKLIFGDDLIRFESVSYSNPAVSAEKGIILNSNIILEPEGGRIAKYFDEDPDGPDVMQKIVNADGSTARSAVIVNVANAFEGEGTEENPYLIKNEYDWEHLSLFVSKGIIKGDMYFKLTDDIAVSTMVGTDEHPFTGTFDGDGKTLTLALKSDESFCAPFAYIGAATIKNLKTDGTVMGGMHCSGLVGGVKAGDNIIENCEVAADIICDKTHCGGILGHGGAFATTISDCVFSGSITGGENAGTIWGWSDDGAAPVLKNCLDVSESAYPIGLGYSNPDVTNTYYTNPDKGEGFSREWENNGKLAYIIEGDGIEIKLNGETGVMYNGKIYAAPGETVSIELPHENGFYLFGIDGVEINANIATLTMPAENLRIIELTSITIEQEPEKFSYYIGEDLDTTGLAIRLNYSDGYSEVVKGGFELSEFDSSTEGEKIITVTYGGKTAEFKVAVKSNELIALSVANQPEKTVYYIGEELDTTGLQLKAEYEDGTQLFMTKGFELSELDSNTAGEKTITVTYDGKTTEFSVTVKENELVSLTVVEQPEKILYYIGEELDTKGLKLKAEYEDGSVQELTEGFSLDGFDSTTAGEKTVVVTYGGKTAEFKVTVKELVLLGDVNGDGEITILDAVYIQKYLAEIPDKDFNISAADVTEEGTVTLIDVVYIQRWLAKLPCSDKIGQPM